MMKNFFSELLTFSSDGLVYACFAGLGWTYPCDLWSVGCILVELCAVSFFFLVMGLTWLWA